MPEGIKTRVGNCVSYRNLAVFLVTVLDKELDESADCIGCNLE